LHFDFLYAYKKGRRQIRLQPLISTFFNKQHVLSLGRLVLIGTHIYVNRAITFAGDIDNPIVAVNVQLAGISAA
jgi:hypothetical protein